MQDLYKKLLSNPEEAWNLIAASRPTMVKAVHPLWTVGLLVASFGTFLRFLFIRTFKMAAAEFFLHLLVNLVAMGVLVWAIRKEFKIKRGPSAVLPTGVAMLSAGALALPVWLSSFLLALPMPFVEWLWLALGVAFSAFHFRFASVSVMAIPQAEMKQSGVRVLGYFTLVLIVGRILCNLVAGNALFLH